MKIDLDIDPKIPQDAKDIILRAESYIHSPAIFNADALSHIISQMMQQMYLLGCMDGTTRTHGVYTDVIKNLGKAVVRP